MCVDCVFWDRRLTLTEYGLTFAPCLLKPLLRVRDRAHAGGFDIQAYVTQDSYSCPRYTSPEGTP